MKGVIKLCSWTCLGKAQRRSPVKGVLELTFKEHCALWKLPSVPGKLKNTQSLKARGEEPGRALREAPAWATSASRCTRNATPPPFSKFQWPFQAVKQEVWG